MLRHIAYDISELARARSIEDFERVRARNDPRAEQRRRLAEPDTIFAEFCARAKRPSPSSRQCADAWTAY
ncbi:hypothetical protein OG357_05575 [Streptomyces sp. NBC_01255]|uniref:hypothetical protein n=1 Tax=Streptomyces sp. NBC_01255 TaxID=2903798 RepID=UPI002E338D06|nr:hypothetical protein [Streptomyces sp. NBC_01255]